MTSRKRGRRTLPLGRNLSPQDAVPVRADGGKARSPHQQPRCGIDPNGCSRRTIRDSQRMAVPAGISGVELADSPLPYFQSAGDS